MDTMRFIKAMSLSIPIGWRRAISMFALLMLDPIAVAQSEERKDVPLEDQAQAILSEPDTTPAAFRGTWAETKAACRDENAFLIRIGARSIETVTSFGGLEVRRTPAYPQSILVKIRYQDEGYDEKDEGGFVDVFELWTVSKQGDKLIRSDSDGYDEAAWVRCK